MNKKFLSAILFGALMVSSTGTFVSCKDYDDDIDNLQGQITANADAIKALQDLVGSGKYVTSVAKTADGHGITFTFNQGDPVTITLDDETGSGDVVKVVDGILYINDEPQELKVATSETKPSIIMQDGVWAVLQEDGTYKSTGVPVSGVSVVGSEADGFTLTIFDKDGNKQEVKVPSAAALITSIILKDSQTKFTVSKATFNIGSKEWKGERELPADKSVIYSSSKIDVRINPVDAPATEAKYYLTNTKNKTLSNIVLTALPENDDDAIDMGHIGNRAANTGNGLYTLGMEQYILAKDNAAAFDKELKEMAKATDDASDIDECIAFAVNANNKARSAYGVAIITAESASMTGVQVKEIENSKAQFTDSEAKKITVKVGKEYTIDELDEEAGLMFDMFFSLSEKDQKTYGVKVDNLKHTFTVTNNPDVSTAATGFNLTVNTLDTKANINKVVYAVELSTEIETPAEFEPVVYNIAQLKDADTTNDAFTLDMDIMKEALGDKWAQWANSVAMDKVKVAIHAKADCSDNGVAVGTDNTSLKVKLTEADKETTPTESTLKYIVSTVNLANPQGLTLDKQYYMKVTFLHKSNNQKEVNSIVVPVTFTAPSVAEQFTKKDGYLNQETGVIEARYYDVDKKYVEWKKFFETYDAKAHLDLSKEDKVVKVGNTEYCSDQLAIFDKNKAEDALRLRIGVNNALVDAITKCEFGYGKTLTVIATNDNYADTGWKYDSESKKGEYSFTIAISSPIYEGIIQYAEGTTVNIKANAEKGFAVTKNMISLKDYNNNNYNVVPDTKVTNGSLTNNANNTIDVWSADQIENVWVSKAADNTYIKKIELQAPKDKTETEAAVEGAIVVYADPLQNTTPTTMTVNVKDAWGYTKAMEVSVTIVKE
jgi:hypothetical protein